MSYAGVVKDEEAAAAKAEDLPRKPRPLKPKTCRRSRSRRSRRLPCLIGLSTSHNQTVRHAASSDRRLFLYGLANLKEAEAFGKPTFLFRTISCSPGAYVRPQNRGIPLWSFITISSSTLGIKQYLAGQLEDRKMVDLDPNPIMIRLNI